MSILPTVKVAACHVSPVFLDTRATVAKGIRLIREAASNGADLVVFPETWIPGFPLWSSLSAPTVNHDLFKRLALQAIHIDGAEIASLRAACAEAKIFAQVGFNERSRASIGCIWNASVLISDDGSILNHHRKIVPTFYEKLTWANGDGAGLRVVDTRIGRVGALICGENGYAQQLHVSHWPPAFPTRPSNESRNFNLPEATRIRVAAHCFEGKCFGVICGSPLGDSKQLLIDRDPSIASWFQGMPQSSTMFLNPAGQQVGDERSGEDEGIAYATFDLNECIEPKQFHDFTGGYQRLDIFKLTVNRERQEPVTFIEDAKPERSVWNQMQSVGAADL